MMTPASGAALDRLLHDVFGLPIKDLPPPNAETLKRAEQNLSKLAATYKGQKYLAGDHITYPDLVVAAVLVCLVNSLNDEEKGQFNTWDNGKWAAMLGEFGAAGYLAMDDGEIYKADQQ
jgi:glutathione S-transferase